VQYLLGMTIRAVVASFAVATLALAAAGLTAAPAATATTLLTAPEETAHEISYGIGTLECEATTMQGESDSPELTEFELSPHYTECEMAGEPAEVKANGCVFVLTGSTKTNEAEEAHAPLGLSCPAEAELEIVIPSLGNCAITIAPQTSGDGVAYTAGEDEGAANVTIATTAQFAASRDNPESDFLCSLLPAEGTATYTGASILKGYEDVVGEEGERGDIAISPPYLLTAPEETAHEISYGIGTLECEATTMQGESDSPELTEFELSPHYTECEMAGEPAEVKANGCVFVLTGSTKTNEAEEAHAPLGLSCPAEAELEIVIPSLGNCAITIAPQTSGDGVAYTAGEDEGAANVTIATTAQFAASRDNPESDFLCSLLPAEGTATYTGASILKGYEDVVGEEGERVDVSVE